MSRLENTVVTRFPQPIARAWTEVMRAPNRERALLFSLDVTARTVLAMALAEYVAGPREDATNGKLFGTNGILTKSPTLGSYQAALVVLAEALGRRSDRILPAQALGPTFLAALDAARLSRNDQAHPEDGESSAAGMRKVALDLFEAAEWLATARLLRPGDELTPDEQGVLRGTAVLLAGPHDEGQSQVNVRWPASTARGALYLVPPDGRCLLRVHPFIAYGRGRRSTRELVYLFRQAVTVQRKAESRFVLRLAAASDGETQDVEDVSSTPRVTAEHWLVRGGGQDLLRRLGPPDPRLVASNIGAEVDVAPFQRVRELGRTQVSLVLEVVDPRDKAFYALKFLIQPTDEWERRLEQEIATVRSMSHPHILTGVTRELLPDGRTAMRMPVFPTTLQRVIDVAREEQRPPDLGSVLRWMRQLCSALAEIHRHKHVHRDVKPSNLFLKYRGDGRGYDLVVADFGCIHDPNTKLTHTGAQLGTRDYEDPRPSRTPLPARDIYSAGIVLGELCTLLEPGELMQPRSRRQFLPAALYDVFREATSADPEERPDARALDVRLQEIEAQVDEPEDTSPTGAVRDHAADDRHRAELDARRARDAAASAGREALLQRACEEAQSEVQRLQAKLAAPAVTPVTVVDTPADPSPLQRSLEAARFEADTLRSRLADLESHGSSKGAAAALERRLVEANAAVAALRGQVVGLEADLGARTKELESTRLVLARTDALAKSRTPGCGMLGVLAFMLGVAFLFGVAAK